VLKRILKLLTRKRNKPREPVRHARPKVSEYDISYLVKKEKGEIEKCPDFLSDFGDNFEQKRAVVSDCKRILVLAGAGSGKTKVLTKRFIHLVKNKDVSKDRILAVTFTREAANEMVKRISQSLNTSPDNLKRNIRTFHSFCFSILRQNEQFRLIDEDNQRKIIDKIIYHFHSDENIMQSMYDYITDNLLEWIKEKDNEHSRDPQVKTKPNDFGQRRIQTFSGVPVRSKSERDIANFLTSLGLKWEYEKPVSWADESFFLILLLKMIFILNIGVIRTILLNFTK